MLYEECWRLLVNAGAAGWGPGESCVWWVAAGRWSALRAYGGWAAGKPSRLQQGRRRWVGSVAQEWVVN